MSTAPCWTRSSCIRSAASAFRAAFGQSCGRRQSALPPYGESQTRGSGRRAASRRTTCRPSSCAGWRSIAHPGSPSIRGDSELASSWANTADEIKREILERGVSERGVLRQHYDTEALDASNLLALNFGFLRPTDERIRNTVHAIADELTERGFVLRYKTDETDDGLAGEEGTFLICSFWLVSALAAIGELNRARDLMDTLLKVASPLGLYAEELDASSGHQLGNFPQAFSHLALLEAAALIIVAERTEELFGPRGGGMRTHTDGRAPDAA